MGSKKLSFGVSYAAIIFAAALTCLAPVSTRAESQKTCVDAFSLSANTFSEALFDIEAIHPNEFIRASEEATFKAVEASTLTGKQAQLQIERWYMAIQSHQLENQPLTPLEHVAVLHILRTGFLNDFPDQMLVENMRHTLRQSWRALTGKDADLGTILESRLPATVLRNASHEQIQFHNAVFNEQRPNAQSPGEPFRPFRGYVFRVQDALASLALVALSFNQTGGEVIGAAIVGGMIGVTAEYLIHRYLAHPSGKARKQFAKMGWLGKLFLRIAYSHHNVHHGMLPDYHDLSSMDREKVEARLQKSEHAIPVEIMREREFGLLIDRRAAIQMMVTTLPFSAAAAYVLGFDGLGAATLIASSLAYIPHVNFVHRYLHTPRDQALADANPLVRWFLNTRYFAFIARQHYVHHEAPNRNFNVTPGFDGAFGSLRRITIKDLIAIRNDGGFF